MLSVKRGVMNIACLLALLATFIIHTPAAQAGGLPVARVPAGQLPGIDLQENDSTRSVQRFGQYLAL